MLCYPSAVTARCSALLRIVFPFAESPRRLRAALGSVLLSLVPLASASWVTPQAIENTTESTDSVDVAVDPQGNAIAVWRQYDTAAVRRYIWGARYNGGNQTWGAPFIIANVGDSAGPVIGMDANGNAFVAWSQCDDGLPYYQCNPNVWARRYDKASATWAPPTLIERDTVSGAYAANISIAVGRNGDATVGWAESNNTGTTGWRYNVWAAHYTAATGVWGADTLVENDNSVDMFYPQAVTDGAGNSLMVWSRTIPTTPYNYTIRTDVMANRYDAATGTWGTPVFLENDSTNSTSPGISMDAAGNGMVVWTQRISASQGYIWAARFDAATNMWSAPSLVETTFSTRLSTVNPRIKLDDMGNALATWGVLEPDYTWNIWVNRYNRATGTWGASKRITPAGVDTRNAEMAIDPSGNALLLWQQRNVALADPTASLSGRQAPNPYDIWSVRYIAATQTWLTPELAENNDTGGVSRFRFGLDAEGHGIVAWVLDGNYYTNRYFSILANHTNKVVCTDCTLPAGRVGQPYYTNLFSNLGKYSVITGTQGTQPPGVGLMIDLNTHPDPDRPHDLVLKGTPTLCGVYTFGYKFENRVPGKGIDYIPGYGNYLTQKIAILPRENLECGSATGGGGGGGGTTYQLPAATPSTEPYWMQYARQVMTDTVNIYHCGNGLASVGSPAGCPYPYNTNYSLLETHRRAPTYDIPNNQTWKPFYGASSGMRPGYFKTDSFNNVLTTYTTLFYLATDQYDINTIFCSTASTCAPYTVKKTIWAGEVRDGWGLVPSSPDLLSAYWVALMPPGKTFGQNGIGFANFTVSIGGAVAGDGVGPTKGTRLTGRSAYEETQPGYWDIYLTGVCTSNNGCYADVVDYGNTLGNLNQATIDPFNTTTTVQSAIAKILEIKQANPNAHITLYGHSLGATEATLIYNLSGVLGPGDTVYAMAVPEGVSSDRLLQRPGLANFIVIGSDDDYIAGLARLNLERQNWGVNLRRITTSGSGMNPHNRCLYQTAVFGACFF
jgi:hypothetical protein